MEAFFRPLAWACAILWLAPLTLVAIRSRTHAVDVAWWWMAVGFAVSFPADVTGALGHESVASQVYPAAQAAIFILVLAPRPLAVVLIGAVFAASGLSIALRHGLGYDLALHVVAWGIVAVLADLNLAKGRLREALTWGFGFLPLTYAAQRLAPGYWTWGMMRVVAVAMLTTWCLAMWQGTQRRAHDET